MSQQEFIPPENQYAEGRRDESPPGEASAWQSYENGYRPVGEKLRPGRPHRSTFWTPLVCFALTLFIGGTLFGFALSGFSSSGHPLSFPSLWGQTGVAPIAQTAPQQSFPVDGPVHLKVRDLAPGAVHIHTGDSNKVVVTETAGSDSMSVLPPVQSSQQGNAVTISIENQGKGVTLDIALPRDASLEIEADTATINFVGALNPNGTYKFVTQTGSVNLDLPADSAFFLQNVVETGDFENEFGNDVIGNSPRATLAILAYNGGSVTLKKH